MNIDDVIAQTFLEGVGVSIQKARKSAHYQQLVRDFPHVPYLTAEQTADMALLGEHLAERAFSNLPVRFRRAATNWQNLDEARQEKALLDLYDTLGPKSRARRERGQEDDTKSPASYLPHQYGSWSRGKVLPNCLGLAQLLIGFGHVTGAQMMLSTALKGHDIATLQTQHHYFSELTSLIAPHSRRSKGIAKLYDELQESRYGQLQRLASLERPAQAHHALVLRTKSKWWMIDPYFEISNPIEARQSVRRFDTFAQTSEKKPRESAAHTMTMPLSAQVRKQQAVLAEHSKFFGRLDEPSSSWAMYESGLSLLANFIEAAGYPVTSEDGIAAVHTHINEFHTVPQSSMRENFWKEIQRSETNKHLRNQMFVRLVEVLISAHIDSIYHLWFAPTLTQECHHATFQLGVFTVNQIAIEQGIDIPELCLYSHSQWILHDSIAAARTSERTLYKTVVERAMRHIQKQDSGLTLPQLRPFLEKEDCHVQQKVDRIDAASGDHRSTQ